MGNPVQTCSESRQPFLEQPEHPAYHLSFPLLGPVGHGALPFPPTRTGYRKPEKGAAAPVSNHSSMKPSPTPSSKQGRAVSILCTRWLSKKDVTGPRKAAECRMPVVTEAASWHCSSDLSSSQEPQGVVRQKVMSKHLRGSAASGLRALNSEPQIVQQVYLQPQESEECLIASDCGHWNLAGPRKGILHPHNFDSCPFTSQPVQQQPKAPARPPVAHWDLQDFRAASKSTTPNISPSLIEISRLGPLMI